MDILRGFIHHIVIASIALVSSGLRGGAGRKIGQSRRFHPVLELYHFVCVDYSSCNPLILCIRINSINALNMSLRNTPTLLLCRVFI